MPSVSGVPPVRVVVTGATGQLGRVILREFGHPYEVIPLTRADLDLRDGAAVGAIVRRLQPAIVINCAAYNDVDGAEDDPTTALQVNAFAVRALVRASADIGARLVHYSTDFVFDGMTARPYVEDDQPNPRSFYAASKLLGEWFALEIPTAYVLRVASLFGGAAGKSSVDRIAEAIRHAGQAVVFRDRTVSPSFVVDVARATREVLERQAPPGLYHCVNSGYTTWYELAQEMARQLGREAVLRPVSVDEVRLRVARPRFAALSNAKLRAAGVELPGWNEALARWLAGAGIGPSSVTPATFSS